MWQYGFISGLWLSLAIISIPWGYIVSEPLLALRSGVEDLIYLSQGLRDHPARLLYRIIPDSLVLFLRGRRKRRCNMRLHTCQTELRLVIPEERSTGGNAFKCILCHGLLAPPFKKKWIQALFLYHGRFNPQHLVLEHSDFESMIWLKEKVLLRTRGVSVWVDFCILRFYRSVVEAWTPHCSNNFLTWWNCIIQAKNVELPLSLVSKLVREKT